PHVADGRGELDVAEPLAADLGLRHFDTALVADDAAVLHALVLAAQALPIGDRTEDLRAEQAVPLRLERAVIDRFRLGYLAVRPRHDLVGRGEADANGVEIARESRTLVKAWSHYLLSRGAPPPLAAVADAPDLAGSACLLSQHFLLCAWGPTPRACRDSLDRSSRFL